MLTSFKHLAQGPTEYIARIFLKFGFSPNSLTLTGLGLGFCACGLFIWTQNAVLFGVLIFSLGLFDALDGALARLTHQTSKFGSYLDAMCDRIFDAVAIFSVAWVSGEWILCFFLVVGGLLVSYAKARAAMEIMISNNEWPDLMERTERGIVFAVGVVLWGIFGSKLFFGADALRWMLILLNGAVYFTLLQRMFRARRFFSMHE